MGFDFKGFPQRELKFLFKSTSGSVFLSVMNSQNDPKLPRDGNPLIFLTKQLVQYIKQKQKSIQPSERHHF